MTHPIPASSPSVPVPSAPATIEALMDAKGSAKVLGISPRLLWSLTKAGQIPCVRLGRAVRYDPADLRTFIERSKGGRA